MTTSTNNNCVWYKDVCSDFGTAECNKYCIRFMEMSTLCKLSNIPKHKWKPTRLIATDLDVNSFMQLNSIKKNILKWVQEGNNLYLYSPFTGNGKTSWAITLCLSYFNQIWSGNGFRTRAVFVSVPTFLIQNKQAINSGDNSIEKLKQDIMNCDLVVWDDIAISQLTPYEHQILLTYIDNRILQGKANIFTGNVIPNQLGNYLGARLTSRICNSGSCIQLREQDKRLFIKNGI